MHGRKGRATPIGGPYCNQVVECCYTTDDTIRGQLALAGRLQRRLPKCSRQSGKPALMESTPQPTTHLRATSPPATLFLLVPFLLHTYHVSRISLHVTHSSDGPRGARPWQHTSSNRLAKGSDTRTSTFTKLLSSRFVT